jgi:hypothetical protein
LAINTTDYSSLEDAVKATIVAVLGKAAGGYIPDASIMVYDDPVTLDAESFAEWGKGPHGPKVIITTGDIADEEFVEEGGVHPRKTWQTVTLEIYLYEESLRGNRESTVGMSGVDNAPGIYKLINDVRAALTGYVAAVNALKWQGPFWQNARKVEKQQRRHLWRMECNYTACVQNVIDTSTLDDLSSVDADYNREGDPTDIAVETLTTIP